MKRIFIKGSLIALGLVAGVVFAVPAIVSAEESNTPTTGEDSNKSSETNTTKSDEGTKKTESPDSRVAPRKSEDGTTTTRVEDRREVAKEKLKDAKLRVCKDRQENVNKIMGRVVDRSLAQVERITKVADKAKVFYVKQGNVLENYNALVADVDAKKLFAESAVATLEKKPTFSCDSEGPKSDIADFNSDRLKKTVAIDDYRKSVKALIVGIKSVQPEKTTEGEAN